MLTTTCIIDTYNHERFVCEAVESALAQSVPFDQIVVVDDASSDQSRGILEKRYGDDSRVNLIFRKANGGQLACIQSGVKHATGDICCFLDGDDQYDSAYLERVIEQYRFYPKTVAAYVVCEAFESPIRRPFSRFRTQSTGMTVGLTLRGNSLIGAPTSCLSFRRELLGQMFPYPFVSDWVIRADDYLNGVSSILGAQKMMIAESLVRFRWHDRNNSWDITQRLATYRRRISLNRLRRYYEIRLNLNALALDTDLHREFATWESPSWKLCGWYLRTIFGGNQSWFRKVSQAASLLQHQVMARHRSKEDSTASMHYSRLLSQLDDADDLKRFN